MLLINTNTSHHEKENQIRTRLAITTSIKSSNCNILCNVVSKQHSMELEITTPDGKELHFVIDDWEPKNEDGQLTQIVLIFRNDKKCRAIVHSLEYCGIDIPDATDYLIILSKPTEFKHDPKKDKLILKYN